jgi:hypothetical protein
MANFCLATNMTPAEYRSLSGIEYATFVKLLNRSAK